MKVFKAKNAKQLELCLRLLFSAGFSGPHNVRIIETKKKEKIKISYEIYVDLKDDLFNELTEKYRLMLS